MQARIDEIRAATRVACRETEWRYRERERENDRQNSRHNHAPWRGSAKLRREFEADIAKILDRGEAQILAACAEAGVPDWFSPGGARPKFRRERAGN